MSGYKYKLLEDIKYYSPRYNKNVIVPFGYLSDGATGAIDIDGPVKAVKIHDILDGVVEPNELIHTSEAWWVHDKLCDSGKFEDGSPCTNWQASQVLQDILKKEGRRLRSSYWFWATWFFGGDKARENGMI